MDPLIAALAVSAAFCLVALGLFARTKRTSSATVVQSLGASPEEATTSSLRQVFWIALGVRVLVSVVVGAFRADEFFAPDYAGYEALGSLIASAWHGNGFLSSSQALRPFHYYNAIFFFAFGDAGPWFAKLGNCLAGAAAVPLVYRISNSIYGEAAGRFSAWVVALMPSLVLWSALDIRDAWGILAVLWTTWSAIRLREEAPLGPALNLAFALTLLGAVRGYMFLIVAGALLLAYASGLGGSIIRNYIAGAIALTVFIYIYSSLGFGKDLVETASFQNLNTMREGFTQGADSAYLHVDISTPGKALVFLPMGVLYFLFAPFPWMLAKFRQAITLPEMLLWWWLAFRYLLPGLAHGLRTRRANTLMLASVGLACTVAYGLAEANVGTAYRHRAQILPLLLSFAAGGVVWARQQRRVQAVLAPN